MRNMSFSLTTHQFITGKKDVTRRLGWKSLKPGDHFMGVEKLQGLRKGDHVIRLGECLCVSTEWEPLDEIIRRPYRTFLPSVSVTRATRRTVWTDRYFLNEMVREGFPELTARQFVEIFCKKMQCKPDTPVNRIEFEKVDGL